MKMLYTANGRYIRCCTEEGTRPVIIVCEKEYEVDVQEFMLWSILNWRILREEEIGSYYEKMANNTNVTIHRSWQDCVQRLLVRGLIVAGTGDTEYDALYDLLACRFIVPIGAAWPLRVLSFLKLTFLEGISWKITRRLFHVDARSSCEKKVIRLARQTPLSCAEIIKCIEMGLRRLKDGYDVLDKIRALDPSVNLSLSIGIGRGAKTLREAQDMAVQALDMAQGRGGDQAAEMTPDGFTFYGGVSHGVEKRSKVRSRIVADQLVKLIKEADHVVIMGHRMSDLDAIGSAEGVLRICKICDVPAVIAVRRDATLAGSLIDALCRAGQKDDFIDPKDALPIISKRTLCIVVDTYQVGLVESKDILEKCGKVAVIDHHRKGVGYIENPALVCHEPYSSSASELVTELLQYVGERDDKPNRVEAEGLLSGIMLDTRDFTLHTGVRTFEAAAALRRYGAETERVRQLFDVTMVEYNAKADLVEKARMYKNCAISVSGEVAPEARVAIAQAANDLLTIQGVDASFVAVQVGTGVNISARSLGAVNVQVIMESLGGGGHQTMAAAQLKHITPEAARARIEDAIDKYYASQKKGDVEGK